VDQTLAEPVVQTTAAAHNLIGAAMAMPGVQAAAKRVTELVRYIVHSSASVL
jgi:hypothetical protein